MSPRKPPHLRRGKAGTTKDFGTVTPIRRSDPPPCPARLGGLKPLASTVKAWERLWTSDIATVIDPESDLPALTRWAELIDERDRALRAYRRKRLVPGSMGQATLNPIWKVVVACEEGLRQLEDRFGFTPRARLNLGITFVEAAQGLDELNRMLEADGDVFDEDEETEGRQDPRLAAIDTTAS